RESVVETEEVRHVAEMSPDISGPLLRVGARHRHRSSIPGEERTEDEHGCCLPGAVGSDQPEYRTLRHGQIEPRQGVDASIALLHGSELDHHVPVPHSSIRSLGLIGLSPNSSSPDSRTYTAPSAEVIEAGSGSPIASSWKEDDAQSQPA